jgi:hypothetical protein
MNFIIKTHKKDTQYNKPCLFLLNKGLNSGKPKKEPFTNSFVIIFENQDDLETMYFLSYNLWRTKFWNQYLIGSVIEFIRIGDVKKVLYLKSKEVIQKTEHFEKQKKIIQLIEQKESQYKKELILMDNIRTSILHNLFK